MTIEERDIGSVGLHVYKAYLLAIGGIWLSSIIIMGYVMDTGTKVGNDWWLSYWSDSVIENTTRSTDFFFFRNIYWMGGS